MKKILILLSLLSINLFARVSALCLQDNYAHLYGCAYYETDVLGGCNHVHYTASLDDFTLICSNGNVFLGVWPPQGNPIDVRLEDGVFVYYPPKIDCATNEFLNSDNQCETLYSPTDFPDETSGGSSKIYSANIPASECVTGTISYSGIACSEVLNYDYNDDTCKILVFYCNDGLTWDNNTKTCHLPLDLTSFPVNADGAGDFSNNISQDLFNSCTSGQWALRNTYDFCNSNLGIIPFDLQDYGLEIGKKYDEYQCTSDFRIKKYLQVSCGSPSTGDFNSVDLTIAPAPDVLPLEDNFTPPPSNDNNATAINTGQITKQLSSLLKSSENGFNTLENKLNSIKNNINDTNKKLDDISNSLNANDDDYLALNDIFTNFDNFFTDTQNSLNNIQTKFDETKTLFESGFTYTPPSVSSCINPSTTFHGSNIELDVCTPFATFSPIFYFIFTIIFTFIAIAIFILGVRI